MKRLLAAATLATGLMTAPVQAAPVEIVVEYSIPDLFKAVHETIAKEFMAKHPDIKIRFKAPQPPAAWSGVRKADTPGLAARQTSHPIPGFAASDFIRTERASSRPRRS